MTVATTGEFGALLRGWRARRRLSQIELAVAADTTQRHLSFLEQGRSTPGRDIIIRLAEPLALTPRQRNELLASAGFAPAHPEFDMNARVLQPVRAALQHVLDGHLPYPAMVMDGFGELVGSNSAFGLLAEDVAPWLLNPPVNVFRIALHPEGMARRIINLDDWRRLHLRSRDGEVRLIATISTFVTALDVTLSELRLEAFLPADPQTAAILAARRAGSAGGLVLGDGCRNGD